MNTKAAQVIREYGPFPGVDKVAGVTILERNVNGQPGLVVQQAGATVTVVAFTVTGDLITHIWSVRNPEKLRSWSTERQAPRTSATIPPDSASEVPRSWLARTQR